MNEFGAFDNSAFDFERLPINLKIKKTFYIYSNNSSFPLIICYEKHKKLFFYLLFRLLKSLGKFFKLFFLYFP